MKYISLALFVLLAFIGCKKGEESFKGPYITSIPLNMGINNYNIGQHCLTGDNETAQIVDYSQNIRVNKLTQQGATVWSKEFQFDSGAQLPYITEDDQHNLYLSGVSNQQVCVFKISPDGDSLWTNYYGESASVAVVVKKTTDNNLIFACTLYSVNDQNITLIKINSNGALLMQKIFSLVGNPDARNVIVTSDGGYLIHANSALDHFIKTDAEGDETWTCTVPYSSGFSMIRDMIELPNDGYLMVGYKDVSTTTKVNYDFYIQKLSTDGSLLWTKTFGDENSNEKGYSIIQNDNNSCSIAGSAYNSSSNELKGLLSTISSTGEAASFIPINLPNSEARSISKLSNGKHIIIGTFVNDQNAYSLFFTRTDNNGNFIP